MYAKMCILHTCKRESFKASKHFRTTYVPAAERFHTWKYRGINILFIRFPFLKLITHPGKWCSVEENSFVEWSCLLGLPKAWQRRFSEGNLRRIGPGMILIFSFGKWNPILPPPNQNWSINFNKQKIFHENQLTENNLQIRLVISMLLTDVGEQM